MSESTNPARHDQSDDRVELKSFHDVYVELDQFINGGELAAMAELFDDRELPEGPYAKLRQLQEVATENWNFRGGKTRQDTKEVSGLDVEGTEPWNVIFEAATRLGMVESSVPVNRNPDIIAIPGGANRAPLDRLRYALENVDSFGQITYHGSLRKLPDSQKEAAADYAPGAQTEFDLGCGAFESLLGAKHIEDITVERQDGTWTKRVYEFEHNGETKRAYAFAAPEEIGDRGPNTYDGLNFLAQHADLAQRPDQSVLLVTNGHYTAFMHPSALLELTLAHGTPVETIGFESGYAGIKRLPSQLLQETKSAIDAAVRLQRKMGEIEHRRLEDSASEYMGNMEFGEVESIENYLYYQYGVVLFGRR